MGVAAARAQADAVQAVVAAVDLPVPDGDRAGDRVPRPLRQRLLRPEAPAPPVRCSACPCRTQRAVGRAASLRRPSLAESAGGEPSAEQRSESLRGWRGGAGRLRPPGTGGAESTQRSVRLFRCGGQGQRRGWWRAAEEQPPPSGRPRRAALPPFNRTSGAGGRRRAGRPWAEVLAANTQPVRKTTTHERLLGGFLLHFLLFFAVFLYG